MPVDTYHFKAAPIQACVWEGPQSEAEFVEFLGADFYQTPSGAKVHTRYQGGVALAVGDYVIKVTVLLPSSSVTIVDVVSPEYFHSHFVLSRDVLM